MASWATREPSAASMQKQQEVRLWIEGVLQCDMPSADFFSCIRDGKVLCRLAKALVPEEEDVDPEELLILENVDRFLQVSC